jgi:hypothetical protein
MMFMRQLRMMFEPNNSFADAKPFLPNDTLGGRIAYIFYQYGPK